MRAELDRPRSAVKCALPEPHVSYIPTTWYSAVHAHFCVRPCNHGNCWRVTSRDSAAPIFCPQEAEDDEESSPQWRWRRRRRRMYPPHKPPPLHQLLSILSAHHAYKGISVSQEKGAELAPFLWYLHCIQTLKRILKGFYCSHPAFVLL